MALSHAILATLLSGPVSGYKLTKCFNAAIGYFWQATHQQIYRELTLLEEHSYIERVPSSTSSTEKLYTLTTEGRNVLIEWIMQPSEPGVLREDLLLKVRAGSLVPNTSHLRKYASQKRPIRKLTLMIFTSTIEG